MTSYPEKYDYTDGKPTSVEQPTGYGQPSGNEQPQGYGPPPGYGQPGYGPPTGQPGYPPNTVVVQQPPVQQFVAQPVGIRPSDYLILSIVSIFFCWPMAICAIMHSCNSKTASDAGDYVNGESHGRRARNIGIAAIVLGIVIVIVAIVVNFVVASTYVATLCSGYYC